MIVLMFLSCGLSLNGVIEHNPVHCIHLDPDEVGQAENGRDYEYFCSKWEELRADQSKSLEERMLEKQWDQVCTPCAEAYEWDKVFDWSEGFVSNTLDEEAGETIVPISGFSALLEEGLSLTEFVAYKAEVLADEFATIEPQRLRLEAADGTGIDAYYIPPLDGQGADSRLNDTLLIYNHGNYGGVEHYLPRLQMLHNVGFTILVYEYRGYGKSESTSIPSSEEFLSDGEDVYAAAVQLAPDPDKIVIYANSLGGIPAIEQALFSQREENQVNPVCALMLEASFTSVRQAGDSLSGVNLPGGFLSDGNFENDIKIAEYTQPLFMMNGTEDVRFPAEYSRELFDNAGTPELQKEFWELEGVNHGISNGGVPEAGFYTYRTKIIEYLETVTPNCIGTSTN